MPGVDREILFHAIYVAFAFACLLFGALAFRQVLDNLEVRRLGMGEDREAYLSPAGSVALIGGVLVTVVVAAIAYRTEHPTVYAYALPLVFVVQNVQLGLRLWFQRMQVKTRGLVVRPVVLGQIRAVLFDEVSSITVVPSRLWTTITVTYAAAEVVHFRIFRISQAHVVAMLGNSCVCPVIIANPTRSAHL
jgi:hypothetical protein